MMDGTRYLRALTAVVLVSGGAPSAQTTPQQIVDQFYPPTRLSPEEPADRRSCFAVHSTTTSGEPSVIVAGYTDTSSGVIRVITRNAEGSYGIAYELPTTYNVVGAGCEAALPDLDMDGQRDVFLTFAPTRGGGRGWLFKWDGSALINLTPTSPSGDQQVSVLYNPELYDLSHSGWVQVVCPGDVRVLEDDEPVAAPDSVYQSTGSVYGRTGHALDVTEFSAGATSVMNVSHFRQSADSQGPFVLRVVNGDRLGQLRVTSGTIKLNGVVVVGPSQLTSATAFVEVTLPSLPIENILEVSLTGEPAAKIIVKVSDSTVRR